MKLLLLSMLAGSKLWRKINLQCISNNLKFKFKFKVRHSLLESELKVLPATYQTAAFSSGQESSVLLSPKFLHEPSSSNNFLASSNTIISLHHHRLHISNDLRPESSPQPRESPSNPHLNTFRFNTRRSNSLNKRLLKDRRL